MIDEFGSVGVQMFDTWTIFGDPSLRIVGAHEFPCPGDLDGDQVVNVTDLLMLLGAWGTDGPGADLAEPLDMINVSDLLVLLGAWGECP